MDFTNRGAPANSTGPAQAPSANGSNSIQSPLKTNKSKRNFSSRYIRNDGKTLRVITIGLLFSIAIILIALAVLIYYNPADESRYLKTKGYQAIDLSTGGSSGGDQIYFGNITTITSTYFVLQNVFYIPTSQNSSQITLTPLVCQIDSPYDQMIVNRSNINWWENLQPGSQVVKSIGQYDKTNNGHPTCPASSSATGSNSSTGNSSSPTTNSKTNSSTTTTAPSTSSTTGTTSTTRTTSPTTKP